MQKDVVKIIEDSSTSLLMSVFKKESTIDSQLPIVFKSGYKLEEFGTKCHCCSANLKGTLFKGSIFKVEKNSRFECWSVDKIDKDNSEDSDLEKIMIDAVGFCPQCSVYTPCQIHVEDKGLSEEESLVRAKLLEDKRKEKRSKSFLGLSIEKIDGIKSQRSRISKTKKLQETAIGATSDSSKKLETSKLSQLAKDGVGSEAISKKQILSATATIKKKEFVKQTTPFQKTLVDSRVEEIIKKQEEIESFGKIDENITDLNAISRINTQNAVMSGSKSADAYKVGAILAQPASANIQPSSTPTKRPAQLSTVNAEAVNVAVKKSEPKLGFLARNNQSIASQKLQDAMMTEQASPVFTRKHAEQLNSVTSTEPEAKQNPLLRGARASVEMSRVEPTCDDFDSGLLNDSPVQETMPVRRDSRGLRFSSTSVAAKIEKPKTYVQSSGSLAEKLTSGLRNVIGMFGNMIATIKEKQENKKNDILKNVSYKADNKSNQAARARLQFLREGTEGQEKEFVRKPSVKAKPKKHNHDSFR